MEALSALVPLVIKIGIDPQIAKIGGLEIAWHGVFTAVGVICGVGVAAFFARRAGLGEDAIYNTALALVIGGIIGARALFVWRTWISSRTIPWTCSPSTPAASPSTAPSSAARWQARPTPSGGDYLALG